ncbi:uncharacterized protein [Panulirus ornatus]|uniref:uncharacterized protein n=1 Tax=Panulirus ornatus TaxID=150431 RepID=UPI003A8A3800
MNAVLEEGEDVTDRMLIYTQKRLRSFMFKLLDEKREYKEPKPYHNPYHWQMVPEEDILHPVTDGALDDASLVFPLLCGIFLRPDNHYSELLSQLDDLKDQQKR